MNAHELLYQVAYDFARLTPLEQKNVGIKLGLVHVGIVMNQDHEVVAQLIFSKAFKERKMKQLIKEMKQFLYE